MTEVLAAGPSGEDPRAKGRGIRRRLIVAVLLAGVAAAGYIAVHHSPAAVLPPVTPQVFAAPELNSAGIATASVSVSNPGIRTMSLLAVELDAAPLTFTLMSVQPSATSGATRFLLVHPVDGWAVLPEAVAIPARTTIAVFTTAQVDGASCPDAAASHPTISIRYRLGNDEPKVVRPLVRGPDAQWLVGDGLCDVVTSSGPGQIVAPLQSHGPVGTADRRSVLVPRNGRVQLAVSCFGAGSLTVTFGAQATSVPSCSPAARWSSRFRAGAGSVVSVAADPVGQVRYTVEVLAAP